MLRDGDKKFDVSEGVGRCEHGMYLFGETVCIVPTMCKGTC